jgi:DNA helicase-2/ATP-dependent DNA helicase PcrA
VSGSIVPDLSEVLAAYRGTGYVVAPAGFGKTHLIAEAVSRSANRQLVLTHTYAGVNVLRRKMRELRVYEKSFRADTIASWALRLCLSYPATSGWTIDRPAGNEWSALYQACSVLLDSGFVRRILRASYAGLYVDEYQDCSAAQHELVLQLARDLPCRMLGDPLQGIFDFNEQSVDWERDISAMFESLGQMETPHRWNRAGTPAIGSWLGAIRCKLEQRQPVDLSRDLPHGVTFKLANDVADLFRIQANACRYFPCDSHESVIAIHKGSQEYKSKCHALARIVGGRFSSIEEIEGKALFSFIQKVQRARTNQKKLKEILAFASQCMTAVKASLPAATRRGEQAHVRENTRNPLVGRAANACLADPNSNTMAGFLTALKAIGDVQIIRADLFNRMMGILRKHALHPQLTLDEAAEKYHTQFRYKGRPVGRRKLIGTTLLVKRLEFDHAVVLDAKSLSRKELYVAITRGAKSLTIISLSPVLNPAD